MKFLRSILLAGACLFTLALVAFEALPLAIATVDRGIPAQAPPPGTRVHDALIWASLDETGPIRVRPILATEYLFRLVRSATNASARPSRAPGSIAAHITQGKWPTPRLRYVPSAFRTVSRSLWISRNWSAEQVIDSYCLNAYFAPGVVGCDMAARNLFGVAFSDLSVDEASLILAVARAPSRLDPRLNTERAIAARARLLARAAGDGVLSQIAAEQFASQPLKIVDSAVRSITPTPEAPSDLH